MSEDPKERINRIRTKINQLSKINPNTYLSDRQLDKITQKLEEKRKGIVAITQLDHQKGIFDTYPTKSTFSFVKNEQNTGTIVANYFKKIELKKQQSANNQPIKRQKENSIIAAKEGSQKQNEIATVQNSIKVSVNDIFRKKEQQAIPVQKVIQNTKQKNHLQRNQAGLNRQIHPITPVLHQRQKQSEAIVVQDMRNEASIQKIERNNPFSSKKENLIKSQDCQNKFIDIDKQIPKERANIFKQDFNKNPPKNPFLICQQKKIEIQFQKPKIKLGEQNIFLQENQSMKIKRIEQIQPRFQPIKRLCSQPAPSSSTATTKVNSTDSIFAKSVSGINLQPARNQQIAQDMKRPNERSQNISIRQQKNIFNKRGPLVKNIEMPKPLSSISESISELQSVQDDSALKIPRQKKIPVFEVVGSNKIFQKCNTIQQQKTNHQVTFEKFGAKISEVKKPIFQIEDSVKEIPKLQFNQPEKINIFLSNSIKDNGQAAKINPFKNNEKSNFDEKVEKNNATSKSPIPNIFSTLVNKASNIFSQPNPVSKSNQPQENIFTKMTTIDNPFGKPTIQYNQQEDDEENEENEDNNSEQIVQAQDKADPTLSTVSYDYLKPNLIFKQPTVKFRCGNADQSLQNVTISLEKFPNSEDVFLVARMPNKLVAFNGTLLKNLTTIRSLNGATRSVEIVKILSIVPENHKGLVYLKIQFKDPEIGGRFIQQVEKIIN